MTEKTTHPVMDPKVDFAFKQIFAGNQVESKIVLLAFLNTVLAYQNEDIITDIIYLNPYTEKSYADDKQSIMDIKVRTQADEYINIEIQVRQSDHFRKRSLYYWSTLYGEQIVEGEAYYKLKKCIVINILNFNLLQETTHYHSVFTAQEKAANFPLIDDFEIHYLELPKLKASDSLSTLAEWLLFIRDSDKTDQQALLTTIKQRNEEIKMADDILQRASQDELARAAYQQRRKAYLDRVSSEQYMKKQGLEQGLEQGVKLGEKANQVKTVKNMLRKDMEMADILEITGLTTDEINKIKKN